ncbi:DUF397 domain-containing protein [Actinomadura xylanilytica]|uniref:DUF397 domain-containing protein n=1 Tax=Actinomadura xylanilytica TaxID=887459 RepID=UPI00255AE0CE|nr:DUF397 domain-containing protein [Actinomadura xylanilytica]MDL4773795.1 DUF397 domain-containing protein [Actinomadura xylanilytica]
MSIESLVWRTGSRSAQGANCVEVAGARAFRFLRDSKDPDGAVVILGLDGWTSLVEEIRSGAHDLA